MKDVYDWIAVKRLHKNGFKIKQIARQLKMSKNTVKKLLKQEIEPEYYPTKIDKYKEQIAIWYLSPEYDYIGTSIFKELKKIGYQGSDGPMYRYLRTLKEERQEVSRKATISIH